MAKIIADYQFEAAALARGLGPVAGVDEVGRGPLAGPVTAAAVVLDLARMPAGAGPFQGVAGPCRGYSEERRAVMVDCGGFDHRQGDAGSHHGGFGATASRLWLGVQRRLPDKTASGGASKSRGDPLA